MLKAQMGRCEVESGLNVPTDRPSFSLFGDPDSVRPTDRFAARSAAKKNLGRAARPTDPPGRPGARRAESEHPTDRPAAHSAAMHIESRVSLPLAAAQLSVGRLRF